MVVQKRSSLHKSILKNSCYKISLRQSILACFFPSCQNVFCCYLGYHYFVKYFGHLHHNENAMSITCKLKLQSRENGTVS